ncbi:MAG: hypothetical protein K2G93_00085 [Rikenella sp.]|nr:hypothetical protein [Rikenella sp.]
MKIPKRYRRGLRIGGVVAGIAAGGLLLVGIGFVGTMWMREWRPEAVETIYTSHADENSAMLRRGDTLRIVSWNIGYAGLGDDMDFFYDGGSRVRTSRSRTAENLAGIVDFLLRGEEAGDTVYKADFIWLQEVDIDSRRSYRMNEFDSIRNALSGAGYVGWHGLNYVSDFVPIPLGEPMGRVESGIAVFSRWRPAHVVRYSYPGGFSFPVRLFNLKRCLLSVAIPVRDTADGSRVDTLFINNTHNTAYDTGGMRSGELAFLRAFVSGKRYSITMGDWNCTPPGYRPSREALNDPYFSPLAIDSTMFAAERMTFVYDSTIPSVRYGYEPYRTGHTATTLLDFALCSAAVEPIAVRTIDLGFKNSDHNPVVATFVIR